MKPLKSYEVQKELYLKQMSTADDPPKTKLILIIVANTLDPFIGKAASLDIITVRETIHKIAKHIAFDLVELVIEGKDYNNENVIHAVNSLNPDSDDIVIFYYTGHGFSYENESKIKYPQIDLRKMPAAFNITDVNNTTKNLNDIYEIIKTKSARLNLVIGDCCNNEIDFERRLGSKVKKTYIRKVRELKINKKICNELFCKPKSSILIASATKGQLSIMDERIGSIFTLKFTENLNKTIHAPLNSDSVFPWNKLLRQTKTSTFRLSKTFDIGGGVPGNQQAFYEIYSEGSAN